MIKTLNITKKLSIKFYTKLTGFNFNNFTLIKINTDDFFNYTFNIVICNCMLTIIYENTKRQEALKRLHEAMVELKDE
jgi:hypothetical protein